MFSNDHILKLKHNRATHTPENAPRVLDGLSTLHPLTANETQIGIRSPSRDEASETHTTTGWR